MRWITVFACLLVQPAFATQINIIQPRSLDCISRQMCERSEGCTPIPSVQTRLAIDGYGFSRDAKMIPDVDVTYTRFRQEPGTIRASTYKTGAIGPMPNPLDTWSLAKRAERTEGVWLAASVLSNGHERFFFLTQYRDGSYPIGKRKRREVFVFLCDEVDLQ